MSVAIRAITRLQDADDASMTPGAGTDGQAVIWDNDTSRFVLASVPAWSAPLTAPASSDFAWVNQGAATVTDITGGFVLYAPANSGNSLRILKRAAPAAPYVITAVFLATAMHVNNGSMGVMFRQSSDGKIHFWSYYHQGGDAAGMSSYKMTNETTASGAYGTYQPAMRSTQYVWLRIADNNTNRVCSWSGDGINWLALHTVGRTDFLTADEVGVFIDTNNATYPAYLTLLSWAVT